MAKQTEKQTPQTIQSPQKMQVEYTNSDPVQVEQTSTKKLTKYEILMFNSPEKLKNACENALNDGWELQGGISVSHVSSQTQVTSVFVQAITKVI